MTEHQAGSVTVHHKGHGTPLAKTPHPDEPDEPDVTAYYVYGRTTPIRTHTNRTGDRP